MRCTQHAIRGGFCVRSLCQRCALHVGIIPPTAAVPAALLPSQGASFQTLLDSSRSPSWRRPAGSQSPTCRSPSTARHRGHLRTFHVTVPGTDPRVPASLGLAFGTGQRCPRPPAPTWDQGSALHGARLRDHRLSGRSALRNLAVGMGPDTAHRTELAARIPTGFCAAFPLICCPAAKGNGVRHHQLLPVTHLQLLHPWKDVQG